MVTTSMSPTSNKTIKTATLNVSGFFISLHHTIHKHKTERMGTRKNYTADEIESAKTTIINELSKGKSLLAVLKKHKNIPRRKMIYQWLNPNNPKYDAEFGNNYIQAREDSADLDAEKIEKIVDDVRNDRLRPDQARVMGDLLKWTAGRKKPKKYGDKLDLTTTGKEITQQITVFKLPSNGRDEMSDDE